jgi:hypothetical protein
MRRFQMRGPIQAAFLAKMIRDDQARVAVSPAPITRVEKPCAKCEEARRRKAEEERLRVSLESP